MIALFNNIIRDWESTTSFFGDLVTVDRNRYDVIEKPEWKKKRLEAEITNCKTHIEFLQEQADGYLARKKETEKKLENLTNELAELEKNS